jgi:hypothetical protein
MASMDPDRTQADCLFQNPELTEVQPVPELHFLMSGIPSDKDPEPLLPVLLI